MIKRKNNLQRMDILLKESKKQHSQKKKKQRSQFHTKAVRMHLKHQTQIQKRVTHFLFLFLPFSLIINYEVIGVNFFTSMHCLIIKKIDYHINL